MSIELTIKLTGVDELVNKIDKIVNGVDNAVLKAVTDGCIDIESDAKAECPVDTGRLRSSLTHEIREFDIIEGRVGTNVEYATHVEFGTRRQKPKPYLIPAYNKNKNRIVDNIKKATEQEINK